MYFQLAIQCILQLIEKYKGADLHYVFKYQKNIWIYGEMAHKSNFMCPDNFKVFLRFLFIGLSLLCSKIYLLFLPELLKIYTHFYYFILIVPPIIPFYSIVSMIISQCRSDYIIIIYIAECLLTALIEYLTAY